MRLVITQPDFGDETYLKLDFAVIKAEETMTGQQGDIKTINETVSFPFDRMTVARFRETFPTPRWNDDLQAWTIPGKTARKRIERWLASEADRRPVFSEERGRDAFVITEITGEFVEPLSISERHPQGDAEHIWAGWRLASLEELIHTWPAKSNPCDYERRRGWWQPTLEELREARQAAKSRERRTKVKKELPDGRKS